MYNSVVSINVEDKIQALHCGLWALHDRTCLPHLLSFSPFSPYSSHIIFYLCPYSKLWYCLCMSGSLVIRWSFMRPFLIILLSTISTHPSLFMYEMSYTFTSFSLDLSLELQTNWSLVGLQCCVNFCCMAKWLRYMYRYICIFFFIFFSIIYCYRILNVVSCAIQ